MTAARDARTYRRGTAAALVFAPAVFLLDNLIHPTELTRGHEAEQLAEIAAAADRWQLAHVLGLVSVLGFLPVALGLAYLVRGRLPRAGSVGGSLAALGVVGLGAVLAIDGYGWGILGEAYGAPGADRETLELAFERMQESAWSIPYYVMPLVWISGLLTLSWAAARSGAVPTAPAALFALGAVMVGIEGAVQDNAYFIASAAVLLAGGAWLAATLWRSSDADFAGPRRAV